MATTEGAQAPDRRVRRTRRRIAEAYARLRSRGGRVTVKDLCELADINKTTFYQHYRDIRDLETSLEAQLVDDLIDEVEHPDYIVSDNQLGMFELARAYARNKARIEELIAPERFPILTSRVEAELERRICERHPELVADRERRIMLTFLVRGSVDAFFAHMGEPDVEGLVATINNVRQCLVRGYVPMGRGATEKGTPAPGPGALTGRVPAPGPGASAEGRLRPCH